MLPDCHGHLRLLLAMEVHHSSKVHPGQDVAVYDQKRLVSRIQKSNGSGSPKWVLLFHVADINTEPFSIAKVFGNGVWLVVSGYIHSSYSRRPQLLDDPLH